MQKENTKYSRDADMVSVGGMKGSEKSLCYVEEKNATQRINDDGLMEKLVRNPGSSSTLLM